LDFWGLQVFLRGESLFLQGFFAKTACRTWFFDGKNVVICGHNVVVMRRFFNGEKYANFSTLFFHKNPLP
jgi:hypothetical protein